jgi:hypothetical protein
MFEYFYNEILRRTIISFGTLFNGLEIQHTDASDNNINSFKVPLAYGPTQKFLARLEQSPDLNKSTAISLPRMSFEFTGLTYDQTRKVTTTQQFITKDPTDNSEIKKAYMPVPYNLQFELSIMAKLNDDALQILEQILPYFQPAYNLTVNLVGSINEKRDIPVILENITMQDDYEGDFTSRRVLLYTLRFTAKTYLFGPISSATSDIVKRASISYYSGDSNSTVRDLTYSVKPRAIKDYTGDVVTNLADDLNATDLSFNVDSGSSIISKKYIDVGGEEMFVTKITGNKITVERGKDGTTISSHLRGDEIKGIDYTAREDSDLIEFGDDFGFSGSIT